MNVFTDEGAHVTWPLTIVSVGGFGQAPVNAKSSKSPSAPPVMAKLPDTPSVAVVGVMPEMAVADEAARKEHYKCMDLLSRLEQETVPSWTKKRTYIGCENRVNILKNRINILFLRKK